MIQPPGSILQTAYVVRDLERAVLEWARVLKAGPFFVGDFKVPGQLYRGRPATTHIRAANGYSGAMMIELIQPLDDEPSIFNEVLATRGEGLHHHYLRCADFDAELARLAAQGIQPVQTGTLPGIGRMAYVDTWSRLGAFTELWDLAPAFYAKFERMRTLHDGWDGERPIRPFESA